MTNIDTRPSPNGTHLPLDDVSLSADDPDCGMDDLAAELALLSDANAELLGQFRNPPPSARVDDNTDALAALRRDNEALRARIAELEQAGPPSGGEDGWSERQAEYETLLEEKSEVIRALHLKLQELQEGARRPAGGPVPREEELVQLKAELEEQRLQLHGDEEALMAQMRQMELAMSKDRAELARQRQEVQRLQAELNREIEQSGRDPVLRERLMNLRRPHEAVAKESSSPATPVPADKNGKHNSGLFKRLFG